MKIKFSLEIFGWVYREGGREAISMVTYMRQIHYMSWQGEQDFLVQVWPLLFTKTVPVELSLLAIAEIDLSRPVVIYYVFLGIVLWPY